MHILRARICGVYAKFSIKWFKILEFVIWSNFGFHSHGYSEPSSKNRMYESLDGHFKEGSSSRSKMLGGSSNPIYSRLWCFQLSYMELKLGGVTWKTLIGGFSRWTWKVDMMSLVENMVKKNCGRFPIAVLLTTLICSQFTTAYFFFGLPTEMLRIWGLLLYR
jgi:hypothetical protein